LPTPVSQVAADMVYLLWLIPGGGDFRECFCPRRPKNDTEYQCRESKTPELRRCRHHRGWHVTCEQTLNSLEQMQSASSPPQLHSSKPRPEGHLPAGVFKFCVVSVLPGYYLHVQRNQALPKIERK